MSHLFAKTSQIMSTSDEDTAELEAAVLRRLSSWSDAGGDNGKIVSAPQDKLGTISATKHEKRPRGQRRKKDKISTDLRRDVSAAANHAEKRILEQIMIRSRNSGRSKASGPTSCLQTSTQKSVAPIIMKAGDLEVPRTFRAGQKRSSAGDSNVKMRGNGLNSRQVDAAEFVESHRREIGRFGSQALRKYDRKSFENAERIRFGCRAPKNQKVPIGLLITKRRKQKIRETKKKEMDLATGMLVRSKRR